MVAFSFAMKTELGLQLTATVWHRYLEMKWDDWASVTQPAEDASTYALFGFWKCFVFPGPGPLLHEEVNRSWTAGSDTENVSTYTSDRTTPHTSQKNRYKSMKSQPSTTYTQARGHGKDKSRFSSCLFDDPFPPPSPSPHPRQLAGQNRSLLRRVT